MPAASRAAAWWRRGRQTRMVTKVRIKITTQRGITYKNMSLSLFTVVAAVAFVLGGAFGIIFASSRGSSSSKTGGGSGGEGAAGGDKEWALCVGVGALICVSILGIGWELLYLKT